MRKRILFLAEGATMAHFVRPLALAEMLDPETFEVHVHAPARFAPYLRGKPFATGEMETMPGEVFQANIAKGAPLFPASVLRSYVQKDMELFRRIRPDLIVGDMRPSLSTSAQLEGIPCAVVVNAYWSPYTKHRSIIPELPLTRLVPPRLLGSLYRITEPLAFAVHVAPINKVRREFGLPPLPPDIRVMYTHANYVLYADIPEFVPSRGLPDTHHYIGTCPWAPPAARPSWWERMSSDSRPKVFVAMGSSGQLRVLPALFRALSKLPVAVIIATSGREIAGITPEMYVADLLPLADTAAQAKLIISHGGSSAINPAMAAGTPVLGIPANADQQLATEVLKENGGGIGVRVEEASEKRLSEALVQLFNDGRYAASAAKWADIYSRYDTGRIFRRFLSQTLLTSTP